MLPRAAPEGPALNLQHLVKISSVWRAVEGSGPALIFHGALWDVVALHGRRL
jgi:hypothetical protein